MCLKRTDQNALTDDCPVMFTSPLIDALGATNTLGESSGFYMYDKQENYAKMLIGVSQTEQKILCTKSFPTHHIVNGHHFAMSRVGLRPNGFLCDRETHSINRLAALAQSPAQRIHCFPVHLFVCVFV
jgi:hypothetical protein